MDIVGVPLQDGAWDTTWLGSDASWLEGSAFPTWEGTTVLTGHVWDAANNPGPFARRRTLRYGDAVRIRAWGQVYTYEVVDSRIVLPGSVDSAFEHQERDYLSLVTCELYNPFSGEYFFRRVVSAVLVNVE